MSKIVISSSDVESVTLPAGPISPAKLPSPIPLWARLVFLPLVLFLPLLAIIALVMRIALRATPPRTQQAWHAYLMTLLIGGHETTINAIALGTIGLLRPASSGNGPGEAAGPEGAQPATIAAMTTPASCMILVIGLLLERARRQLSRQPPQFKIAPSPLAHTYPRRYDGFTFARKSG